MCHLRNRGPSAVRSGPLRVPPTTRALPLALLTEEEQPAGIGALNLDRHRALIDALMTVSLLRAPRGRKGFDKTTVLVAWKG